MHSFHELADRSITLAMYDWEKKEAEVSEELRFSSRRMLIVVLQSIQLSRGIFAVGLLSMYEAYLQHALQRERPFDAAIEILSSTGRKELEREFNLLLLAINVLKHGRGRSYDRLLAEPELPFKLKQPGQTFFFEGDVSEIRTLIEVDYNFVRRCADVIAAVSECLQSAGHMV